MNPVLFDFEARSRCRLAAVPARAGHPGRVGLGGRHYWAHPSTQALCAAWYDTANGDVGVWYPGQDWPHHDRVLAAHNWHGFDRHGAERLGWRVAGAIDTSQLARKAGLPGKLDALGQRWCGKPKDSESSRFTKSLSSLLCPPRPKGVSAADWRVWWKRLDDEGRRHYGVQPELTPDGYVRVATYGLSDVQIMAEAWPRLADWVEVDAEAESADAALNDRGVFFDADLARRLIEVDAEIKELVCREAAAELGRSAADVRQAAQSQPMFCKITGAPNAQALTVADMDHPLAHARRALASISAGKLRAGLDLQHADGRLRDVQRYYGGHTGRWSGRGMQLQNLPRPASWLEDADPDQTAARILDDAGFALADGDSAKASGLVSFLVRATLAAPPGKTLCAADFSQVEGRALAWLAGDEQAVHVYTSGADPYKVAASAIYHVPVSDVTKPQRQIGKCAELACGYRGGPTALAAIAQGNRVDLSQLCEARRIVGAWRELHAPIVRFWSAAERAFRRAAEGHIARLGPFEYAPSTCGSHVACFLPSGRPIVYNEVHVTTAPGRKKPSLSYAGTKFREHLYGGKLVENAVQAYCRDLMADALVRAESAGLRPVLTVHDEIVCEVDRCAGEGALAELIHIMTTVPAWAAGFPIGADGWVGERYRK